MNRADLEKLGLEKDVIDKVMTLHGTDIESKKTKISDLENKLKEKDETIKNHEEKITKLGDDLKASEGNADKIKDLEKQIDDFKVAEQKRKDDEEKAQADKLLTDNILEVFGDKQFVNDFTKNSIINQIKADLQKDENKGKGIKDIFETITKDANDIFKNPQHEELNIESTRGGNNTTAEEDAKIREVMGLNPSK